MKKNPDKDSRIKKYALSHKKIIVGSAAMLLLLGWWVYVTFLQTFPLGDKMQYAGKVSYGCLIFCDSSPGATYYYKTNMNAVELMHYFHARPEANQDIKPDSTTFSLVTSEGKTVNVTIHVGYISDSGPFKGSRATPYISIPSFDYTAAKHAL